MADKTGDLAPKDLNMRRFALAALLVGTLFNGCAGMIAPVTGEPAPIRPTQFLRFALDSVSNTWIPAWVDPVNFQTVSVMDSTATEE